MEFTEGVPAHVLEAARRANGAGTFPGLAVIEISGGGARFVPTFRALPLGSVTLPFDPWWTEQRMFDPQGNAVSRKQIVTWLANKDGGAHIDELPPTYEALSRNGSMGLTYDPAGDDAGTCPSPIPAAMRQIAEEVRISVRRRIPEREA
ncbi:hypothetical protein [Arthrobacter sp. RT-1]|uniref:hypothetical protein n=1 Tax=Arthrobacter sp. RT-1 TaxID=2292263 RepID=UPI0011C073D6|nr:hypothetical protein [Arthrobacter sp. RT-1]